MPVANSSVLISLSAIGRLALLLQRFPQGLRVPEAVWREVVLTGHGRPGAQAVAQTNWITVQAVQNSALVSLLRTDLDEGEAEALVLAQEQRCSLILLDEKHARRAALRLGITPLGTVGILLWAKQTGFVSNLRDELDALQANGNFRLHKNVYLAALRAADELA